MTKMTRAMREEFYDVCTRKCLAKRKAGKSKVRRKKYDPSPKRRKAKSKVKGKRKGGSAWLTFVKQHKHMRTSKGLLDLKAISKLWKLKKAKLRGKKRK